MSKMIPFLTEKDLVRDNEGRLIPGAKVCVYDPTSNNFVDIYTYDSVNDTYTVSQNPIYLSNESRPQHSYFADRLVLNVLYKYVGNFADPMSDDDTENWRFVRNWLGAFSTTEALGNGTLHGLSELQDADPDAGNVYVVGYWTDDDCEGRTYVWDPNSVATPDNGYIVKSNNTDTGRWILQFDGEWLPSTYYGVYPGREANMNALMSYPEQIGDEKTAPGVYFKPGDYTASTVAIVTNKKLMIDAGTTFTRDRISANWVEVIGEPTTAICDIAVSDRSCPVHSSWFKDVMKFWTSGSDYLYIDNTDNFTQKQIRTNVKAQNKVIFGQTRVPQTYSTGAYLILDGCDIQGDKLFSPSDYIRFENIDFKDSWFTGSSANLDFNDKVIVRTVYADTLRLANFKNAMGYAKAIAANGETVLDLAGREIGSLNCGSAFNTFRNVHASSLSVSVEGTVTFDNCRIESLTLSCDQVVAEKSNLVFHNEPTFTGAWFRNSRVYADTTWTDKDKYAYFEDTYVSVNFNTVVDNETDESNKVFINCIFDNNMSLNVKRLVMRGCKTNNAVIKIYPFKSNDHYWLYADFESNTFNNSEPIEFTKIKLTILGVLQEDPNCYEVMINWRIVNNTFLGNDDGLRCRYWHDRTGTNYGKTFISEPGPSATPTNTVIYHGNSGLCPSETMEGWGFRQLTGDTLITFSGNTNYQYLKDKYVRCATAQWLNSFNKTMSQMKIFPGRFSINQNVLELNSTNGSLAGYNVGLLLHHDSYLSTENGDLFKMSIGIHDPDTDYTYFCIR